jgi:hypothetical protein
MPYGDPELALPAVRWEEESEFYPGGSEDEDEEVDDVEAGPKPRARRHGSVELAKIIVEERARIIDSESLSSRDKKKLLESNRRALVNALGGNVFNTESVVYLLIIVSMATVIVLAALTAAGKLPKEVTLTFVGTTVGGLLATIAQKIGRL